MAKTPSTLSGHDVLNSVIAEVEDLRRARELLTQLWARMQPYQTTVVISESLSKEIRDYFMPTEDETRGD